MTTHKQYGAENHKRLPVGLTARKKTLKICFTLPVGLRNIAYRYISLKNSQ